MKTNENKKEQLFFEQLKPLIELDGRIMALGQLLYTAVAQFPDNIALLWGDKPMTYRELYNRVQRFAAIIQTKGIEPRDRVLLFFENSYEFYIGYHAITQLGAIVVPLNTFLRERELDHIVHDSNAKLLVACKDLLSRLKEDHVDNLPPILTQDDMALHEPATAYEIIKPAAFLDPDEMATLLYTSGTTGLPKGVMLSGRNIFTNVIQAVARLGFTGQERVLGILPLFHSFAHITCIWGSTLLGCTVIVVPRIERRYISESLHYQPTIVLGVPALFGLLCLLKTADFSQVKYFASGGDALPDRIRAAFALIYNRKLCSGYGLSETSPVLAADMSDETHWTNSVGEPVVGVTIAIRDDKGGQLKEEQIGVIWVKGDNVMLGYYNAPEKTKEVIQNGWFNTGDLGYLDRKGNLIITGREKDVIINKGFKIYPQEIENVISGYPNVIRVGVMGQDDATAGQVPVAYVQLRENEEGIEQTLRDLCMRNLAAYKVPRYFYCTTEQLPITATGKVDKKRLVKQ